MSLCLLLDPERLTVLTSASECPVTAHQGEPGRCCWVTQDLVCLLAWEVLRCSSEIKGWCLHLMSWFDQILLVSEYCCSEVWLVNIWQLPGLAGHTQSVLCSFAVAQLVVQRWKDHLCFLQLRRKCSSAGPFLEGTEMNLPRVGGMSVLSLFMVPLFQYDPLQ